MDLIIMEGICLRCSVNDLRAKEVINVTDGARLGYVSDVEIELDTGKILALIVPGTYRFMGLLGKDEDVRIAWERIKKIGDDVIIIDA